MVWKNTGCPTIMFALHFLLYFWLIVFQNAEVLCFLKIQKICFMIDTRSSKIYSKIAEIIEVKVDTYNMEIIFMLLCKTKCQFKNDRYQLCPQLSFESIFKILVSNKLQISWVFQNSPNFYNLEVNKKQKTNLKQNSWTPCISPNMSKGI